MDDDRRGQWLEFIRLLFYTRFSVLAGVGLLLLAVLPWFFSNPTIRAVYIESNWIRTLTLTWISLLAAALVIMTFRTTLYNAVERFDDAGMRRFSNSEWGWHIRRWSLFVLGIPIPLASFVHTCAEHQQQPVALLSHTLGFAGGAVAGLITLWGLESFHRRFVTPDIHDPRFYPLEIPQLFRRHSQSSESPNLEDTARPGRPLPGVSLALGRALASPFSRLGPGYVRTVCVRVRGEQAPRDERFLAVGHGRLTVFTTLLFLGNLFVLLAGPWMVRSGVMPDDQGPLGTLFFVVGMLMLVSGILPGLAFFFDRYRIPSFWVLLGLFISVNIINSWFPYVIVDHEYDVAPTPHYASSQSAASSLPDPEEGQIVDDFDNEPLTFEEVVAGWSIRQQRIAKANGSEPNKTFVVVTAAGGGIQASGWTTTVFQGLGQDDELSHLLGGIGMISCVSGGSVGVLHFLSRYPELMAAIERNDPQRRDVLLLDAVKRSTQSSLEAVGWGLLFPDTWRNFGLFVRDPTYDRGWVQEQVWAARMNSKLLGGADRSDWRLGHLAYRVRAGELPAVVFNGFSTTTGQRIWMAPFAIRDSDEVRPIEDYLEFSTAAGMQLRLATAARISATFPYVSPTAIAQKIDSDPARTDAPLTAHILENSHLADGGYTDNEGLLTALQIVWELDQYYESHDDCPFDSILLLRIAPFPSSAELSETGYAEVRQPRVRRGSVYLQGLAGPALGLYYGRAVTQLERGQFELNAVQNFFELRQKLHEKLNANSSAKQAYSIRRDPKTQQVDFEAVPDGEKQRVPVSFSHQLIDFRLVRDGKDVQPPLSWKLSRRHTDDLREAWDNWKQDADLIRLLVEAAPPQEELAPSPADPEEPLVEEPAGTTRRHSEPNVQQLKEKFRWGSDPGR